MGKLTEMKVGRVDGVDRPAIRKRFVLVKHEDQPSEVAKDYAGAARAAVEAIVKEGVSFSEETIEVLRSLVELLEMDVDFAAKSEDAADEEPEAEGEGDEAADEAAADEAAAEGDGEDEGDGEGEGDDVEKTYTAEDVEGILAKFAAANGITAPVAKTADVTSLRVTRSRQPQEQDPESAQRRPVKKGEGLFANIVHGKATQPYRA